MTNKPKTLLWLQAGSCGGCTMSFLDNFSPDLKAGGISILWHPSLSEQTGHEVVDILAAVVDGRTALDLLCIEGAILHGPDGTGLFNRFAGTGQTMLDWVRILAPRARYCVAVGSCAAYGGIAAGEPNPTSASGIQYADAHFGGALDKSYRARSGLPVVNIAGCAPHPGWITETLVALAHDLLGAEDLDGLGRPRFFADHLAHHGCARNEFYEFKASAEHLSQRGCMMENLGCKATQAVGDCNDRRWNGEGSCTKGGYPCIACTSPGFEGTHNHQRTPKLAGIPVGLPVDMPKAWFVALAALSKSATPKRVRVNAVSDHVMLPPRRSREGSE
jgi:uptake hydrogenase small subunit